MVNVTFDSFSLVGRIATLPLSIGDCESLTEVCSLYHVLPIPASYVFQRTILNTYLFLVFIGSIYHPNLEFRLTSHQIS
jgi:hypothetical protein